MDGGLRMDGRVTRMDGWMKEWRNATRFKGRVKFHVRRDMMWWWMGGGLRMDGRVAWMDGWMVAWLHGWMNG
jgi:hypothetical protein